jgi:hypothetical protein
MAKRPAKKKEDFRVAAADAKYTGYEPTWDKQPDESNRTAEMLVAFNWYNYHFGKKEAKVMLYNYFVAGENEEYARLVSKVADSNVVPTIGFLARMATKGFELTEQEQNRITFKVKEWADAVVEETVDEDAPAKPKGPTIQDRMRDKALECAGEIEGLFDEFWKGDCKFDKNTNVKGTIAEYNILPQHINLIEDHWKERLAEYERVQKGNDEELNEGYSNLGKIQLRNMIKFCEQVIQDCHSYVAMKKATRTVRKRKPQTPEKQVSKLKYMKEGTFHKVKLESVKPTKLVECKEVFAFNTKTRKLMYFVADEMAGPIMVKNNSLVGIDTIKSVSKILRKPEEQLKEILKASKPNSRKYFADIKALETPLNGRFNENIIILRVH